MTIYKYVLQVEDRQTVEMPKGARVLHVAVQHGELCVWALVDPSEPMEDHRFAIVGTGHPAPSDMQGKYIGTAMMAGGHLVWHVFQGVSA